MFLRAMASGKMSLVAGACGLLSVSRRSYLRSVSRYAVIMVATFYAVVVQLPVAQAATADIRALLIGIDQYQSNDIATLRGAVNDVNLLRGTLVQDLGVAPDRISVLVNEQATRENILRTIENDLIASVQPEDFVVVHFSGHGSRARDGADADEIDGYDETLVPYDGRTSGVNDITDDEIHGLLTRLSAVAATVIFVFDASHSGLASSAEVTRSRSVAMDDRQYSLEASSVPPRSVGDDASDLRPNDAGYLVLTASSVAQSAHELQRSGQYHGALSLNLALQLRMLSRHSTWQHLIDNISGEISSVFAEQQPLLLGARDNSSVFGVERSASTPLVRVTAVDGEIVEIDGGKAVGIVDGDRLQVFNPQESEFLDAHVVGAVTVIQAQQFTSTARLSDGADIVVGSQIPIRYSGFGDAPLAIHIKAQSQNFDQQIRQRIGESEFLRLVEKEVDGQLQIQQQGGTVRLISGGLAMGPANLRWSNATEINAVVDAVHALRFRHLVVRTANQNSEQSVVFDVFADADLNIPLGQRSIRPGSDVYYRVVNQSARDLYFYVLRVAIDGAVELLYPVKNETQQTLTSRTSLVNRLTAQLPAGRESGLDVLKLIVSKDPIDTDLFEQLDSNPAHQDQFLAVISALDKLAAGERSATNTGQLRNSDRAAWTTLTRTLDIESTSIESSGFSIILQDIRDPVTAQEHINKSLQDEANENQCEAGQIALQVDTEDKASCFNVKSRSISGTLLHLVAADGPRAVVPADEFDNAYALQNAIDGAVRVEPLFSASIENMLPVVSGIGSSDDIAGEHDQITNSDLWSRQMVSASDAWLKLQTKSDVTPGAEARGIRIAQIDTGYIPHPELGVPTSGVAPVIPEFGYDYVDEDGDPLLDELPNDDALAIGSIITSPVDSFPGCQLSADEAGSDIEGCVSGVAPGAQLIPLRVQPSATKVETDSLVKAIYELSLARRGMKSSVQGKPEIISITANGLASFSLWYATKEAEQSGLLQINASGNDPGLILWPARFESTIAAAAVDVQCRPWSKTSSGAHIDISAPGVSVWLAGLNDKQQPVNIRGSGTALASGHAAGAAALWIAWHRDNPVLRRMQDSGRITEFFRYALQVSSWQPSVDSANDPDDTHCATSRWRLGEMGPGILDIAALLDVPLELGLDFDFEVQLLELPLFSSIYPIGTSAETIRADYQAIFGGITASPSWPIGIDRFETEVLHHYASNEKLRNSIDNVVRGSRSAEPIQLVITNLSEQDISSQLRQALIAVPTD